MNHDSLSHADCRRLTTSPSIQVQVSPYQLHDAIHCYGARRQNGSTGFGPVCVAGSVGQFGARGWLDDTLVTFGSATAATAPLPAVLAGAFPPCSAGFGGAGGLNGGANSFK